MKLQEAKRVKAIIISDLHLRDTQPVCRLEDFMETQQKQLGWLSDLQCEICAKSKRNITQVPILCGGDIFHKWKASPFLLSFALDFLPYMISTVGNHDLPAHNFELLNKSGAGVLIKAERVQFDEKGSLFQVEDMDIYTIPFGRDISYLQDVGFHRDRQTIVLIHDLIETEAEAKVWAKQFRGASLVVAGDNHTSACYSFKDLPRVLVPGSFNVQTADQIAYKPCIWLLMDDMLPIPVEVPENGQEDITRDHIVDAEEMDERMEEFVSSFITRLETGKELGLDFKANLTSFIKENKVDRDIVKVIWEAVNG